MNLVPNPVRRLFHVLGIDRAVGYSLLAQGWNFVAQPITMFMLACYLTDTERGYQMTFGSIVGVQAFCDLGLAMATLQVMSHEASRLHWAEDGTLVGDPAAKSRLASLLRLSTYWYGAIAVVLFAILLPAGWLFFVRHPHPDVSWRLPWFLTVLATTTGLLTIPPVMLLNGCGRVADTVRTIGLQKVVANVTQWAILVARGALLGWGVGLAAGFAFLAAWLVARWRPAFRDVLRQPPHGPRVDWWREVWPFQWRIAVSAPFGYLTSYIFTPVLFAFAGPVEAGQMGMSLNVMFVLVSATNSWIGVRMPTFGHLIARREWSALDRLFRRVFIQSTALAVAGAVVGWGILVALQAQGNKLGTSMLPPLPLALLMANAVVHHMFHALVAYLRAHKRDPVWWLFIVYGLVMAVAVLSLGRAYGSIGMAGSLLGVDVTVCLTGGVYLFFHYRRAWHAEPVTEPAPLTV
jgi:O-antigen/teichoic acid export membrane protein